MFNKAKWPPSWIMKNCGDQCTLLYSSHQCGTVSEQKFNFYSIRPLSVRIYLLLQPSYSNQDELGFNVFLQQPQWFKPQMCISYSHWRLLKGTSPMLLTLSPPLLDHCWSPDRGKSPGESFISHSTSSQRVTHITPTHNSLVKLGQMAPVKTRKYNPTMCLEARQPEEFRVSLKTTTPA